MTTLTLTNKTQTATISDTDKLQTIKNTVTEIFFPGNKGCAYELAKQYGNRGAKSTWFKLAEALRKFQQLLSFCTDEY